MKKRDTGIAEIINEGVLFAKQVSNHPWFNYQLDHPAVAQKLSQLKAASNRHRNSSTPRSVNEIVTEMLTNLVSSPMITLKSTDDQSLSKNKDSTTANFRSEASSISSSVRLRSWNSPFLKHIYFSRLGYFKFKTVSSTNPTTGFSYLNPSISQIPQKSAPFFRYELANSGLKIARNPRNQWAMKCCIWFG